MVRGRLARFSQLQHDVRKETAPETRRQDVAVPFPLAQLAPRIRRNSHSRAQRATKRESACRCTLPGEARRHRQGHCSAPTAPPSSRGGRQHCTCDDVRRRTHGPRKTNLAGWLRRFQRGRATGQVRFRKPVFQTSQLSPCRRRPCTSSSAPLHQRFGACASSYFEKLGEGGSPAALGFRSERKSPFAAKRALPQAWEGIRNIPLNLALCAVAGGISRAIHCCSSESGDGLHPGLCLWRAGMHFPGRQTGSFRAVGVPTIFCTSRGMITLRKSQQREKSPLINAVSNEARRSAKNSHASVDHENFR